MNFNDRYIYKDGKLFSKITGKEMTSTTDEGYLRVRVAGKEYRSHRVIWEMHNGEIPEGMLIDHIDGDITNNILSNLRLCTRQQNNHNSKAHSNGALGVKGVTKVGNKYRARIFIDGKTISLGTFLTIEEAASAYNSRAIELQKEYAYCARTL